MPLNKCFQPGLGQLTYAPYPYLVGYGKVKGGGWEAGGLRVWDVRKGGDPVLEWLATQPNIQHDFFVCAPYSKDGHLWVAGVGRYTDSSGTTVYIPYDMDTGLPVGDAAPPPVSGGDSTVDLSPVLSALSDLQRAVQSLSLQLQSLARQDYLAGVNAHVRDLMTAVSSLQAAVGTWQQGDSVEARTRAIQYYLAAHREATEPGLAHDQAGYPAGS